jgi:hypothetical protein
MSSQWFQEEETDNRQGKKQLTKDEIFVKAVKDAERSILVVRHVTGNDKDYLRKIPRVVV